MSCTQFDQGMHIQLAQSLNWGQGTKEDTCIDVNIIIIQYFTQNKRLRVCSKPICDWQPLKLIVTIS